MNRLILLGNGFDLAHGLKTSYADFIIDVVKEEIRSSFEHCKWDDYTDKGTYNNGPITIIIEGRRRVDEEILKTLDAVNNFKELKTFTTNHKIEVYGKPGSGIFNRTYSHLNSFNWADIESIYYEILVGILGANSSRNLSEYSKGQVQILNQELDFLRDRLIIYLNKVDHSMEAFSQEFIHNFWKKVCGKNFNSDLKQIHLLNFNYTNTLGNYGRYSTFPEAKGIEVNINHIHGKLDYPESVIFGYGDEADAYYKRMEDFNDNELLRHVKSFGYFHNRSYKNLVGFLESGDFEVWIVGHSCGLSDRVMLKKIFEHPSCTSITIYHYWKGDRNDHTEKTYQISRHFNDKELMRERIKPFNKVDCMTELVT